MSGLVTSAWLPGHFVHRQGDAKALLACNPLVILKVAVNRVASRVSRQPIFDMSYGQTRHCRSGWGRWSLQRAATPAQLLNGCIDRIIPLFRRFAKRPPEPSRLSTIATSSADINSKAWSNR